MSTVLPQVDSSPPSAPKHAPSPTATLIVVCLATFMLLLDATIVAVALPEIQATFTASLSSLQWVVDAYTLPLAALLLTAAVFGDRVGRKKLFIGGLLLFTGASLGCALAGDVVALNIMRAVQGTGAALMMGVTIPLVSAAFPTPSQRAKAIGVVAAVTALATASGPIAGGVLVTGLGWEWIFIVNIPIGIVAIALAIRYVGESQQRQTKAIDWWGTVLASAGLLTGVLAVIEGSSRGWTSPEISALIVASVVLLIGFVFWELRVPHPMVDLRMIVQPEFAAIGLAGFIAFAAVAATANFVAIYFMNTLGYTAFETGVRLLALSATAFAIAPFAAIFQRRVPTPVWLGSAMLLIGVGAYLSAGIESGDTWVHYLPGLILSGAALGIVLPVTSQIALAYSTDANSGMATGTVSALRQLGIVAGVAVFGALYTTATSNDASSQIAAARDVLPPGVGPSADQQATLVDALGSGAGLRVIDALPAGLRPFESTIASVARAASDTGLSAIFAVSAALGIVGALIISALGMLTARRRVAIRT